jgi:hypothetical protein
MQHHGRLTAVNRVLWEKPYGPAANYRTRQAFKQPEPYSDSALRSNATAG